MRGGRATDLFAVQNNPSVASVKPDDCILIPRFGFDSQDGAEADRNVL